ncbi:hypothetical protein ANCDUO_00033 [Ancylostoma duodenale]|uniref:Uncharacterized protein n=1 Tax=Ancylostoma duodenale TaxID=51022 RepID=A0A0C2H6V6_9BILA|nr:hypothetical protein ANCDUO_00033 [Ancylostoma duodenale]
MVFTTFNAIVNCFTSVEDNYALLLLQVVNNTINHSSTVPVPEILEKVVDCKNMMSSGQYDGRDTWCTGPDRNDALYEKWRPPSLLSTLPIISYTKKTVNLVSCLLLSVAGYVVFIFACCIPCFYHYTCRKHSFYHRHKCSRTLVRYCSNVFHYSVFALSLLTALLLVALNVILLSSVHIIGANTVPPEIDRVCITLLPTSRSIHAAILPSPVFSLRPLEQNVNAVFLSSDHMASTVCKPLWEDGELGLGLRRKEAGPWQTRKQFGDRLIAVATQVILNNSIPEESYLELRFDHALLLQLGPTHDRMFGCARGEKSGWILTLEKR